MWPSCVVNEVIPVTAAVVAPPIHESTKRNIRQGRAGQGSAEYDIRWRLSGYGKTTENGDWVRMPLLFLVPIPRLLGGGVAPL